MITDILKALQAIGDAYKTLAHGKEEFAPVLERLTDLLNHFRTLETSSGLPDMTFKYTEHFTDGTSEDHECKFLEKLFRDVEDFETRLAKYQERNSLLKVVSRSDIETDVAAINAKVAILFQHYEVAMGGHVVLHNRQQQQSMDEVVRGMRVLLQQAVGKHDLKNALAQCDWITVEKREFSGPVKMAYEAENALQLVEFLTNETNIKQAEEAARALYELAHRENDAPHKAIVDAGAIQFMVDTLQMRRPSPESKLRVYAARTLRRLAVHDTYERAIVAADAVPILYAMLNAKPANNEEIAAACAALSNLTFQAEHKTLMCDMIGLIPRLVELVQSSETYRKHATNTLRELANNDACSHAIREAKGIVALLGLLSHGSPEECASALTTLWNLSLFRENRAEIENVGGITSIVRQLVIGESDSQRQLAASALAVLAQDDTNDVKIGAAGGVEPLVTMLRTGTESQKNSAVWALAELANDKANATTMMQLGVAQVLMCAYRGGSDIQRARAGLALSWIARLVDNKVALVKEISLEGVMHMLQGSQSRHTRGLHGQKVNAAGIISGVSQHDKFRSELGDRGALPLLLEMMKTFNSKLLATQALCELLKHKSNLAKLKGTNVAAVLIKLLKDLEADSIVDEQNVLKHHLFEAFGVCGSSSELRIEFIQAGGLQFVLESVSELVPEGNVDAKRAALSIISNVFHTDNDSADSSKKSTPSPMKRSPLKKSAPSPMRKFAPSPAKSVPHAASLSDDETVEKCVDMLLELLQSSDAAGLANKALEALVKVAHHTKGKQAVSERGTKLVVGLLGHKTEAHPHGDYEIQKRATDVLTCLSHDPIYAKRIVDAGVLPIYVSLLNLKLALPVVRLVAKGLHALAKHDELHAHIALAKHDELHAHITQHDQICSGLLKLLKTVHDGKHFHSATTLSLLTKHDNTAWKLCHAPGLEELVVLALAEKPGRTSEAALLVLVNLSKLPGCLETLREIGAVAAAVKNVAHDHHVAIRSKALVLLRNMSESRDAGRAMIKTGNVISQCHDVLLSSEADWKEHGVTILTNLNKASQETGEKPPAYEGQDLSDDEYDDDDAPQIHETVVEVPFIQQVMQAGIIKPLVEILEEREVTNLTGVVTLLAMLARDDATMNLRVGSSLNVLVELVSNGAEDEQLAAADAVVKLVGGSKRNMAAAIRAQVGDAFVKMLATHTDEKAALHTQDLLSKLNAVKTVEAAAETKKVMKALTTAAVAASDPEVNSAPAFNVLNVVLRRESFARTLIKSGAMPVCTEALTPSASEANQEQATRSLSLMRRVSETKFAPRLIDCGAVGVLNKLLQSTPPGSPLAASTKATLDRMTPANYGLV